MLVCSRCSRRTTHGFIPKSDLVATCDQLWHELEAFLIKHNITIDSLITPTLEQPVYLDDALDTLLGVSSSFLRIAQQFQEAWQLAQPLEPNHDEQKAYETMFDLARRVATLSPSYFSRYMSGMKNDDEFSLYDSAYAAQQQYTLAETIARHLQAGRLRLAAALENSEI